MGNELFNVILIRYGEIALKGKNRASFENKLKRNILDSTDGTIRKVSGRFIFHPKNPLNAERSLLKVFGITSISKAEQADINLESIKNLCLSHMNAVLKQMKVSNFRITVKRAIKKLKPSPELEKEIGAFVVEKTGMKVKLKDPDLIIAVEIIDKAYVFSEKMPGLGGLPAGIEGKVALLVENESSLIAGLLVMRRGCELIPFAFKKTDMIMLREFGCHNNLILIDDLTELDKIAESNGCRALVVNHDLHNTIQIDSSLTVLRPLVGLDLKEASHILRLN